MKKWAASAVGITLWAGITALASAQGIYTCVDDQGRRITADRLRVDVKVEFYVRVKADEESVANAAQTLGRLTMAPQ